MANRDKIQERWNVDDRRWSKIVKSVGWIWLTGLIIVLAVWYFGWADTAIQLLDTMQDSQVVSERSHEDTRFDGNDSYEEFVSTVLWSNDALRSKAFQASWIRYEKPRVVLFRWSTQSLCWWAFSQTWPHYCPADQTIYLDETFFEDLREKLWARWWDMAQAYVIAHEVWHHVQHLLWTTKIVEQERRKSTAAWNEASVRLELQADCYAWIWSSTIDKQWILEKNEIYEALDAAGAVWDDSIQKRTTGVIQPESWTHWSSKQRKEWFGRWFTYWDFQKCNTF